MVLASAVDEQGDEIYPRKWNHEFIDLPEVKDQKTPSFTSEELSTTEVTEDAEDKTGCSSVSSVCSVVAS